MSKEYIEVRSRMVDPDSWPTCMDSDCTPADEPGHWVNVYLGEDILAPVETMLANFSRLHDDAFELPGMTAHRKAAPKCKYCRSIKEVQALLLSVKGKPL